MLQFYFKVNLKSEKYIDMETFLLNLDKNIKDSLKMKRSIVTELIYIKIEVFMWKFVKYEKMD